MQWWESNWVGYFCQLLKTIGDSFSENKYLLLHGRTVSYWLFNSLIAVLKTEKEYTHCLEQAGCVFLWNDGWFRGCCPSCDMSGDMKGSVVNAMNWNCVRSSWDVGINLWKENESILNCFLCFIYLICSLPLPAPPEAACWDCCAANPPTRADAVCAGSHQ